MFVRSTIRGRRRCIWPDGVLIIAIVGAVKPSGPMEGSISRDVPFMQFPYYVGMRVQAPGAPRDIIHWDSHALKLGADGAIKDDDLIR